MMSACSRAASPEASRVNSTGENPGQQGQHNGPAPGRCRGFQPAIVNGSVEYKRVPLFFNAFHRWNAGRVHQGGGAGRGMTAAGGVGKAEHLRTGLLHQGTDKVGQEFRVGKSKGRAFKGGYRYAGAGGQLFGCSLDVAAGKGKHRRHFRGQALGKKIRQ